MTKECSKAKLCKTAIFFFTEWKAGAGESRASERRLSRRQIYGAVQVYNLDDQYGEKQRNNSVNQVTTNKMIFLTSRFPK